MKWQLTLATAVLAITQSAVALAAENALTAEEKAAGWKLLFDGKTLAGWTPEGESKWRVADGAIVGDAGGDGWLRSNDAFKDFMLRIEFRNIPKGNSGIFLRSANKAVVNPAPDYSYELQINNEDEKYATGSFEDFIQRLKPVSPAPNQWHTYEVQAEGDHFVVKLDGDKVLDGKDSKFSSGHVGLQYHRDSKIEFRNIKLKPLGK
jgi:3-keto-disaccharide hydrolase